MSTSWNRLEVNFPTQETACPLNFPINIMTKLVKIAQEPNSRMRLFGISARGGFSHSITLETQRSIHTQLGGLFLV
jgi:hypothetical protein